MVSADEGIFQTDQVEKNWRESELRLNRVTEEVPEERPVYNQPSVPFSSAWKFTLIGFVIAMFLVLLARVLQRRRKVGEVANRVVGGRRSGFSLIELLVVMAILSVLVGLILPAVQQARESARRTQCMNNLKQIGLALHNYESTWGRVPRGVTFDTQLGIPQSTWAVGLLPYLEMTAEYQRWDYGRPPWEGTNLEVAKKGGAVFICPSMVEDGEVMIAYDKVKGASYFPVGEVSVVLTDWLVSYGDLPDVDFESLLGIDFQSNDYKNRSFSQVRDGLSNTLVLVESCGGNRRHLDHSHSVRVEGGSVFHPANPFILDGVDDAGASPGASWGITNGSMKEGSLVDMEPFSFHPGRMNVLMVDGSVRGLNLSIPLNELIKGIGIADGTNGEF